MTSNTVFGISLKFLKSVQPYQNQLHLIESRILGANEFHHSGVLVGMSACLLRGLK